MNELKKQEQIFYSEDENSNQKSASHSSMELKREEEE